MGKVSRMLGSIIAFAMVAACSPFVDYAGIAVEISVPAGAKAPGGKALPVDHIVVTATGGGFSPITKTVSAGETEVSIQVPAGKARTVDVELVLDPGFTGIANSYGGSATVDLEPNETKSVSIAASIRKTKIIAIDGMNMRLVQIDDMSGAGWKTILADDIEPGNPPAFSDVDFDAAGRIYITSTSMAGNGMFRAESFTMSALPVLAVTGPFHAVAVDRARNVLYYLGMSGSIAQVCSVTIDPGTGSLGTPAIVCTLASPSAVQSILQDCGLAVDKNGLVYFIQMSAGMRQLARIEPLSKAVETFDLDAVFSSLDTVADIWSDGSSIFLSEWGTDATDMWTYPCRIYRFDCATLAPSGPVYSYPIFTDVANDSSRSLNARKFVSALSGGMIVQEEGVLRIEGKDSQLDQLAYFEGMNGAGRIEYGGSGTNDGQFNFFDNLSGVMP